jgi:hypothetical protein
VVERGCWKQGKEEKQKRSRKLVSEEIDGGVHASPRLWDISISSYSVAKQTASTIFFTDLILLPIQNIISNIINA